MKTMRAIDTQIKIYLRKFAKTLPVLVAGMAYSSKHWFQFILFTHL